jgi:hypothetical protein
LENFLNVRSTGTFQTTSHAFFVMNAADCFIHPKVNVLIVTTTFWSVFERDWAALCACWISGRRSAAVLDDYDPRMSWRWRRFGRFPTPSTVV